MPTLEKKKDYAERAARSYAEFKRRTDENHYLTQAEKAERRQLFLESHISIFDDYYADLSARPRQGGVIAVRANEALSQGAQNMAADIAALFGSSGTGLFFLQNRGNLTLNSQAVALDQRGQALLGQQSDTDSRSAHVTATQNFYQKKIRRTAMDFSDPAAAPASASVIDPRALSQARIARAQGEAANAQTEAVNARRAAETAQNEAELLEPVPDEDGIVNMDDSNAAFVARTQAEQAWQTASVRQTSAAMARAEAERVQLQEDRDLSTRRSFSIQVRDDGLEPAQIKGIREVTAFLFRNTLHGREGDKTDSGFLVDSLLNFPPRKKLLVFYLIQNDLMSGALTGPQVIQALMFTPVLEEFKPHILGSFRGVFGRWKGDSLKWSKLSSAVHGAEDLMPKVDKLLGLDAAAAPGGGAGAGPGNGGGAALDPQVMQAIQDVINAGRIVTGNPNPTQEQLTRFMNAVKDLNVLTRAQEGNIWDNSQAWLTDKNQYVKFVGGALGVIAGVLKGISEVQMEAAAADLTISNLPEDARKAAIADAGREMKAWSTGFSWGSVPLGTLSSLISCVNLLNSFVALFRQNTGAEVGMQFLRFTNDTASTCNSVYSSVRGIAGLAGANWIVKAAAVNAAGGAGIVVGAFSAIQGVYRAVSAQDERDRIDSFTAGYSQRQQGVMEEKRQLLLEIAAAERDSTKRREAAGWLQTAAGGMQAFAGAALLFSGGTAAIVSAAASGVGLVLSITGAVVSAVMRNGERIAVVDRFIDLDNYYQNFKREHTGQGYNFEERYGNEKKCKETLRKFMVRALSFTSVEELYTHIIRKYAEALYKGTFLDNEGKLMTTAMLRTERAQNPQDYQQRQMFARCLYAFGFTPKFPTPPGSRPEVKNPYPGVNTILKKLMK